MIVLRLAVRQAQVWFSARHLGKQRRMYSSAILYDCDNINDALENINKKPTIWPELIAAHACLRLSAWTMKKMEDSFEKEKQGRSWEGRPGWRQSVLAGSSSSYLESACKFQFGKGPVSRELVLDFLMTITMKLLTSLFFFTWLLARSRPQPQCLSLSRH